MRIGVTGSGGNVGKELVSRGAIPIRCDVTNVEQTNHSLGTIDPDVVIHCAAITNVHDCEVDDKSAMEVNVRGALNVADAFEGVFVLISSDHIFPGNNIFQPNGYKEDDVAHAINVYGLTKMGAEAAVLDWRIQNGRTIVVRTSKLFTNVDLKAMRLRACLEKDNEVTGLIKRSFLRVDHFVSGLFWLLDNLDMFSGRIINISGTEIVSYYQFWKDFCEVNGLDTDYLKERKTKLDGADPRPFCCGLDVSLARSLGMPLYSYRDGLKIEEKKRKVLV